jgi:DNA repair exonuclease SbcCD nuclease subunit
MKYIIVGDLHIGQTSSSLGIEKHMVNQIFHKTLLDYGKWLKNICDEHMIKDLIFLGDIFDSRTAITLESLHYATEFFNLFETFNVDTILGNHDVFFNDSTEIHSLASFKNHPNITIHEKVCKRGNLTFCPWATKLEDIPPSEFVFGHFDIVGYELTKGKISNHGFKGVDLMKRVYQGSFSGHYHIWQKRLYDGKPLIYTGSAYPLSFNDVDSPKYLHILDTNTGEIERIENTISPKFKYVQTEKDLLDIQGNFISVISTDKELIDKVNICQPLSVRIEIVDEFKVLNVHQEEIKEFKVVDIPDAISSFCLNLPDLDMAEQKEVAKSVTNLFNSY